jgi:4-diphosphocytidyl-2-C-methyl-D-erythritol kinase
LNAIGSSTGIRIYLEKRIPMEAGLGGGSSNAATVLWGLNRMFDAGLSIDHLSKLAAEIGSDCPLFLYRKPLVMRGRGEVIQELDATSAEVLEGRRLAVFKPDFGVPTGWAYSKLSSIEDRYVNARSIETKLKVWASGEMPIERLLYNSFEAAVFNKFIPIPALFSLIREEIGVQCLMSGSGSACFALTENDSQEAELMELVASAWGKDAFFQRCRLGSDA